jgi:hypothetical protein
MGQLADGWHISNWCQYVLEAFVLQFIIGVVMAFLSAFVLYWRQQRSVVVIFWEYFKKCFIGLHPADPEGDSSDYGFPVILGFRELLSYPVLIKIDALTVIGAWLTLKTVAQFPRWTEHRGLYNRFLIGNALVVLFSVWLAGYVVLTVP